MKLTVRDNGGDKKSTVAEPSVEERLKQMKETDPKEIENAKAEEDAKARTAQVVEDEEQKAIEVATKRIQAREQACIKEVNEVLKKHNCAIVARWFNNRGTLDATADIKAIPKQRRQVVDGG